MLVFRQKKYLSVALFLFVIFSFISCQKSSAPTSKRLEQFPPKIVWAWERPENLEFLDAKEYAVAFLAQTLELKGDDLIIRSRRQPLKVNPESKIIAVTRIESVKTAGETLALSASQRERIVDLVLKTSMMKNVSGVQIDFDAAVSEREFYTKILQDVRGNLPNDVPLSITALASFCIGDRWLKDLPIDEAIPMIFRMGADNENIKKFLADGNDFAEPLCRKSYGISNDEPLKMKFDKSRRIYIFNAKSWTENDLKEKRAIE